MYEPKNEIQWDQVLENRTKLKFVWPGNISQQPDSGSDCPSPSHHSDDEVEEDQSHVTPFSSQGQETGVTACETTNKNIREILDTLKLYTYVNQDAKASHKILLQL